VLKPTLGGGQKPEREFGGRMGDNAEVGFTLMQMADA
jgi:hypothetical protein